MDTSPGVSMHLVDIILRCRISICCLAATSGGSKPPPYKLLTGDTVGRGFTPAENLFIPEDRGRNNR